MACRKTAQVVYTFAAEIKRNTPDRNLKLYDYDNLQNLWTCFVVNPEKNEDFEHVLSILMVPVKAYDESSNTYTIHVTYKLMSYIQRECRFRDVTILTKKQTIVNNDEYRAYKEEQKANK